MANLRNTLDGLSGIVKILLYFFFDPLVGGLYRMAPMTGKAIVVGILWFVTGSFFGIGAIVDIITVIFSKKITVLA